MNNQTSREYVSCIGLAVYNGSGHPVGTGRRCCLFSRSTIYSLVFRSFDA